MNKNFLSLLLGLFLIAHAAHAQSVERPKLVVGIVVDQMRWDYLYRYYDVYKPNGGFKRLLKEGFTCDNAFIPYTPTVTAAGHASVYTGSVPAIHGITGNSWYDYLTGKTMYCAEDNSVNTIGSNTDAGKMSPVNMLTTTIGDELRLATNFRSKVIGIAIKDRGAILPAGHSATAAYWYDSKTGAFISSSYYMNALPAWVNTFNNRRIVDSLYRLNWNISLPKEVYPLYCTADQKPYERPALGKEQLGFPYDLTRFINKDYGKIASTPHGNTLTLAMAEAAVIAENLGKNTVTDMLAVSFSSPDYIGHAFGPNSWEQLDDYARLDETLGQFFSFLDAQVGKGNYTVFLTADHGVSHIPNFSIENKLPGGPYKAEPVFNAIKTELKKTFGYDSILLTVKNDQVVFNNELIHTAGLDKEAIIELTIRRLEKEKEIAQVFALKEIGEMPLTARQRDMVSNGYFPSRCGDIQIIFKPGYVEGGGNGASHGNWNPYDSHIPMVWYGWGIQHGKTNRETYMTDFAATLAALLHIQMPSGCIGHVVEEVMN